MILKTSSIALAFTGILIAGCSTSFEISDETRFGDLSPDRDVQMQAARGTTFVREIRSEDVAGMRPIFLTAQNKSLRSVLQETLPGYAIIPRGSVNLNGIWRRSQLPALSTLSLLRSSLVARKLATQLLLKKGRPLARLSA